MNRFLKLREFDINPELIKLRGVIMFEENLAQIIEMR